MVLRPVLILSAALVLAVGCEKKSTTPPAPAPAGGGTVAAPAASGGGAPAAAAPAAGAAAIDASKMTATVSGTITVDGTVPAPAPVDMKSKEECMKVHGGNPPLADQVVVSATKGLKDCFVYVKKGLESVKFPVPSEPAVIDQKGCMYSPHVFGIMVGQDLKVLNSDPFSHNINVRDNNPFNEAMVSGQAPIIKKAWFKKEGVPTNFACEIHSWMQAKACVVKNPCYSVTDADGKFSIKLPAGKYTLAVWHETYPGLTLAQKEVEIEVKDGEAKTQDFQFKFGN